jgi:hypothetical protein
VKDGGCNHMTCSQCAHEFCWKCKSDCYAGCSAGKMCVFRSAIMHPVWGSNATTRLATKSIGIPLAVGVAGAAAGVAIGVGVTGAAIAAVAIPVAYLVKRGVRSRRSRSLRSPLYWNNDLSLEPNLEEMRVQEGSLELQDLQLRRDFAHRSKFSLRPVPSMDSMDSFKDDLELMTIPEEEAQEWRESPPQDTPEHNYCSSEKSASLSQEMGNVTIHGECGSFNNSLAPYRVESEGEGEGEEEVWDWLAEERGCASSIVQIAAETQIR